MTTRRFPLVPSTLAILLALAAATAGATCQAPAAYAQAARSGGSVVPTLHLPASWKASAAMPAPGGERTVRPTRSIAGFWKVTFSDSIGNVTDFGYNAMHEGGTETLVSFGRPPVTGDVCLGAWTQQGGPHKVKVSHYAPIFDTDNLTLLGTLNFIEELTLSPDGQSYAGTMVSTGYDLIGNVMFQFEGQAAATRVDVGTPVN